VTGDDALLDELEAYLAKRYKNLSVSTGEVLDYTGMEITFDLMAGTATIRQTGYVDDMMRIHKITGTALTPATQNLFTIPAFSKPIDQKQYLSKLMKAMYLAKRTRSDTLLALAYLASHSAQPTEDDDRKLTRVYMYVNGTRTKPNTHQAWTYSPSWTPVSAAILTRRVTRASSSLWVETAALSTRRAPSKSW
jgi:hypothetical protein